jgi:hypothetical protein
MCIFKEHTPHDIYSIDIPVSIDPVCSEGSGSAILSVALNSPCTSMLTGDSSGRIVCWVRQAYPAERPALVAMPRVPAQ